MSLNLHFRPKPILVTVSLALIVMVSGLVILWLLIPEVGEFEDVGETFPTKGTMLFVISSFAWFLVVTMLVGLIVAERVSMAE
jgi:hypothetical protein